MALSLSPSLPLSLPPSLPLSLSFPLAEWEKQTEQDARAQGA